MSWKPGQSHAQARAPHGCHRWRLQVSTKLTVLESLSKIADQLVVGGGIADTFIAAAGHNVGKSLCEHDLLDTAKKLAAETVTFLSPQTWSWVPSSQKKHSGHHQVCCDVTDGEHDLRHRP
ncbi:phosphoglycerate kinase [Escherichia coli]